MAAESAALDELAAAVAATQATVRVGPNVAVADLEHDSRDVTPGAAFIAIPGENVDGHDYADTAIRHGAAAIVCQRQLDVTVPQLVVEDTRRAMGALAAAVHGNPAAEMTMIGVTGTNGKTTVTHMLEGMARSEGFEVGLVGTIGAHVGDVSLPLKHTTPEATDLHRMFAAMRDRGVAVVMVEVSSHALAMRRVDGLTFDIAGFTNLSQDHLDYHGTMEQYYLAKAGLFTPQRTRQGCVVVRDEWGKRLAADASVPITTVALDAAADVSGTTVESSVSGTTFTAPLAEGAVELVTPLAGWFNAENALLAAVIGDRVGWSLAAIKSGLASVGEVAGRFERVDTGQRFAVIVDYAHTPEAMALAIDVARSLTQRRVIALGGAGGDRDTDKRRAMGAALGRADLAVVTSDNPRSEPPEDIVTAVASGLPSGTASIVEVDRRTAMRAALAAAEPEDVVLLLGRGHEPTQDLGETTVPFLDRAVAEELLTDLSGEVV